MWSKRSRTALPADWEIVNSSGHCSWFFAQMPSRPQEKFLSIREFGAIGNGISFAMGVAAARPDEPVVLFDGDGSLMMHVQELETIKRHGLNILIIVMNDGAYGSEVHKLRSEGLPEDGSVFGRPDFAAIARGFGIDGKTFKSLDDLPKMVEEFAKKRRRRGLGLPRLGQGRVADDPARPSAGKTREGVSASAALIHLDVRLARDPLDFLHARARRTADTPRSPSAQR